MNRVHILGDSYWPDQGGVAESIARIAGLLAGSGERTCIVYVRDTKPPPEGAASPTAGTVVYLWRTKAALASPALASVTGYAVERHRIDYLLFRNAVSESLAGSPADRHVLVSFYLSTAGFLAQHVACELGLPHIACARGTDLSADLHIPSRMPPVEFVVRRATHVVTSSGEQERWLRATGLRSDRMTTIHNSLPAEGSARRWRFRPNADARLVSDGGYQFNKGTHLLFAAYRHLVRQGVRATLTVMGKTEEGGRAYWERERQRLVEEFGDRVRLLDHVDKPRVYDVLLQSDLYCSATLGEGCSNSRLTALALGMPIVSTRCGELADLADGLPHVRLVPPGCPERFADAVAQAARELPELASRTDTDAIDSLRRHVLSFRELAQWEGLLSAIDTPSGSATRPT